MWIYFRTVLYIDHDGISRLTNVLSNALDVVIERTKAENGVSQQTSRGHVTINDEEATVLTNTMKVLFNCTLAAKPEDNEQDKDLMSNMAKLCGVLHLLLTLDTDSRELTNSITR